MDLGLAGRRALVTGASGGIGTSIAARLAAEDVEVVVHGRRRGPAEELAEQLRAGGGRASAVSGDLGDAAATSALLEEALGTGPIDVLVANAGPWQERGFDEATDGDWRRTFETNVLGVLRCVRRLTPDMRRAGWGRIVTVTTRGVLSPLANMPELSAAKAAVANLTGALAKDLADTGITVNTVSPGVIVTPSVREMFEERARRQGDRRPFEELEPEVARSYAPNPTGRLGRPEDLADAVAFLVSERASYVNGATLRVDGGLTGTVNP